MRRPFAIPPTVSSLRQVTALLPRALTARSLVVLDVDDVLLTTKDAIFRPRRHRHEHQGGAASSSAPSSSPAADGPFHRLAGMSRWRRQRVLSAMYLQADIQLTEPCVPQWISQVKTTTGAAVVGLTAFDTPSYGVVRDTVAARMSEFERLGIDLSDEPRWGAERRRYRLRTDDDDDGSASSFVFAQGVMFSGSMPKGPVLHAFLSHCKWTPDQVVFVDNHHGNLTSVAESVPGAFCVHYDAAYLDDVTPSEDERRHQIANCQIDSFLSNYRWLDDAAAAERVRAAAGSPLQFPPRLRANPGREAVLRALCLEPSHQCVIGTAHVQRSGWSLADSPDGTHPPVLITPYHWPDVDGVACAYSLRELLLRVRQQSASTDEGRQSPIVAATAQSPQVEAQWLLKELGVTFPRLEDWMTQNTGAEAVVLVDTSDAKDLPDGFPLSQIRVVIDHRTYSDPSITSRGDTVCWIDPVGSAATLIGELYVACGVVPDATAAALLYAAIMSNTVRLATGNTTERDRWMATHLLLTCETASDDLVDAMFEAKSVFPLGQATMTARLEDDTSSKLQSLGPTPFDQVAVSQLELVGVTSRILRTRMPEVAVAMRAVRESRKATAVMLLLVDVTELVTYLVFEDASLGRHVMCCLGGDAKPSMSGNDESALWSPGSLVVSKLPRVVARKELIDRCQAATRQVEKRSKL